MKCNPIHRFNTELKPHDSRPYIVINIGNKTLWCLADTGATTSLISQDLWDYIRSKSLYSSYKPINQVAKVTDGREVLCVGIARVRLRLKDTDRELPFYIMPSFHGDILLGIDNLTTIGFSIQLKTADKQPYHSINMSSVGDQLTEARKEIKAELESNAKVKGPTSVGQHVIKVKPGVEPIKFRYTPRNPAMQQIINEEVDKMLEKDVIEPSSSPWSSPVVLVKKKNKKYRFCIDFRKINDISEKDAYPLPQVNSTLDKLRNAKYMSTIDLENGYWQVPLDEKSKPVTAFTVPGRGLFQFKVMPFGLHSASATFQRLLNSVIGPDL